MLCCKPYQSLLLDSRLIIRCWPAIYDFNNLVVNGIEVRAVGVHISEEAHYRSCMVDCIGL